MHKILIKSSNKPLVGRISINGAKNAILPIMAASILCDAPVTLFNVPDLVDVHLMSTLLKNFGAEVNFTYNEGCKANHTLEINCSNIVCSTAPHEVANRLRASFLMLGPMLSKFGKIKTVFPGGCDIGERPVSMHIKALEKMGAKIEVDGWNITAEIKGKLQGKEITFERVSVGATENVVMAATLAEGVTIIHNPAVEPEVLDMIRFLKTMGADISVHDNRIIIKGVEKLRGCSHRVIPDRIEAGTYSLAAIITRGRLELEGINLLDIRCIADKLQTIGANIESKENSIIISRKDSCIRPINVATNSYPDFPSDMQPQLMSAMCLADGVSTIEENIFENRFMHVGELKKMGASINVEKKKATIIGTKKLFSSNVNATDLRSTAALILSSLIADGETVINNSHYLYRGYEAIHEKLNSCGANISILI